MKKITTKVGIWLIGCSFAACSSWILFSSATKAYSTETLTPKAFLQLGGAAFAKNELSQAADFLYLGLKYFPENSLLWKRVAYIEQLQDHEEKSFYALKKASTLDPKDAALHAHLSLLYYQQGSYSNSWKEAKAAVDLRPQNREYLFRFTQLANLQGEYTQSLQAYEKLKKLDPENPQIIRAKNKIEKLATTNKKNALEKELLLQAASTKEALQEYRFLFGETAAYQDFVTQKNYHEILKKEPKNAEIWYRLASHHYNQEALEEAQTAISQALAVQGRNADKNADKNLDKNIDYLMLAARIAGESGKNDQEIGAYRKILALDPHNKVALNALNVLLPGAYASYTTESCTTENLSPPAHLKATTFLALGAAAARSQKETEALNIYQMGTQFFPQEPLLWKAIAEVQKCKKETQGALQAYRQALKYAPKEAELHSDLAEFYIELREYKEALGEIEKAVELKHKNLGYLSRQAQLANLNEDYPLSIYSYNQILKLHPQDAKALYALPKVRAWMKENCGQGRESQLVQQTKQALEKKEFSLVKKNLEQYEMLYGKTQDFININAELVFVEGLNKNPREAEGWYRLARFYDAQAESTKALVAIQKALELKPHQREYKEEYEKLSETCTSTKVEDASNPACYWEPCYEHNCNCPLDLVLAQRCYCQILENDPGNRAALENLARVTACIGQIDRAAQLYCYYYLCCPPTPGILGFVDVLEAQGNIRSAFYYLNLYFFCFGNECNYRIKRVELFNSAHWACKAYQEVLPLVNGTPEDTRGWYNFTLAAAALHHPREALYGLNELECRIPGSMETRVAEWAVLPPLMSKIHLDGEYYHESTSLTQILEGVEFDCAVSAETKLEAGVECFQTKARDHIIRVMGLGNYAGVNGQTTGSEELFWVGMEHLFHPQLQAHFLLGAGHEQIQGLDRWTPAYEVLLESRVNDALDLEILSSYGYYLVSPRTLSLKIRQWQNSLSLDYHPCYGSHLIATVDTYMNTDHNQQAEIYVTPRQTCLYLAQWQLDVGIMGNWLLSSHEFQHGYYSPHLYQAYGGEVFLHYFAAPNLTFNLNATGGTQKDNFSSFWGPLAEVEFEGVVDFSLNWQFHLFGDYYYIKQSEGSFNSLLLGGRLTCRY